MAIVFVLIIMEGAISMDVFLNSNWEEVRSSAVNFDTLLFFPYICYFMS